MTRIDTCSPWIKRYPMCGLLALAVLLFFTRTYAGDRPVKKFLLIGIDGCRTDALLAAPAPHLHTLLKGGAFSKRYDVLGDRKTGADTLSGPGWTTLLTGVWADKHGIQDNGFRKRVGFATFFSRLRAEKPAISTVALVSWKALAERVFDAGDGVRLVADGATKGFDQADRLVADAAVTTLTEQDPAALFAFFGQVDQEGHKHGFHPKVEQYVQAIAAVDGHVGRVLEAVSRRKVYDKEDWLVIVAADHGGRSHDEVRRTFLILSGPSVVPGEIMHETANVDVAVTALTHLGLEVKQEWKLDGRCVGLRGK